MRVIVDQDTCISCGACVSISPEVYQFNAEDKAEAIEETVSAENEEKAKQGRDACPVDAIDVKEE